MAGQKTHWWNWSAWTFIRFLLGYEDYYLFLN
jgi:hypothetical protein